MAKSPIIPRHPKNPVGQTQRLKRARKAYRSDLAKAEKLVLETLASWPVVRTNRRGFAFNAFYEFLIDLGQLSSLVESVASLLRGGSGPEASRRAASGAYREGTAKVVENLSGLSDDYTRTVTQRLADSMVLRRASLAGARVFEEMQGFAGQTADELRSILFRAVSEGQNPRDTAKLLRERFGIARRRADRIARTEITGALRRGRWDEAREAEEQMGLKVAMIHYSALIPGRTRRSHAKRHGKIVTPDEQAQWYSRDGNAINCLCSQTEVTLDENGEPLFGQKLLERMAKQRDAFLKTGVEPGDI